jgi:hypothetical protein
MIGFRRSLRSQRGVALIAVMLALLVLSLIVSALVFMTMGETTMNFNHLHSQQALAAAEAGAYRMLAELRHRVAVDGELSDRVGLPTVALGDLDAVCEGQPGRLPINIFTDYAYPGGISDWRQVGATAILDMGTSASPVVMSSVSTGAEIATFHVTLYVRSSERPPLPGDCVGSGPDPHFVMWFDYAIVSTGRVGNAVRTVCLQNRRPDDFPRGDRPCSDWVNGVATWRASHEGFPVLVQRPPISDGPITLLGSGSVWFSTGATFDGPVRTNGQLRIAGSPRFNGLVTQVDPNMHFWGCGGEVDIAIDNSQPSGNNSYLSVAGCDLPTFDRTVRSGSAYTVGIPPNSTNPARAAVGLTPLDGSDPSEADVRNATADDAYAGGSLQPGVYVMDACGAPSCGIYIQGDVLQMVLRSENGVQVILLTMGSSWDPDQRNQKIIIDPSSGLVKRCWMLSGVDPGTGDCLGWTSTRIYHGVAFNGLVYINGAITSDANPAGSSGLYGMVNRNTRMTLAADGEIRITDHLVYETPPAGPGHTPTNVLGLWSRNGNVTIVGALAPNDVYIDAAVLAPRGSFWVDGWNAPPVRGNVYFLGSTLQLNYGAFGGFNPDTGYGRVMAFDWRLASDTAPPHIPRSQYLRSIRWPSDASIFVGGDTLYDRPKWEELAGM